MITIAQIIEQARALRLEERKELVKQLIDTLTIDDRPPEKRSLTELRGLGKEIWAGVDTKAYLDELRDEWDQTQ